MNRRGATSSEQTTEATVDLLSDWVRVGLRTHQLRRNFTLALVSLLVLLVGAWGTQQLRLYEARQELRGDRAVEAGLAHQIADLTPVSTYIAAIGMKATTVRRAMYNEVAFSEVLSALRTATPGGATVETVSVTIPGPATDPSGAPVAIDENDPSHGIVAPCPGPDPFEVKPIVGCVSLVGTAADRATVGRLVTALSKSGLFVEPFITTTTTGGDQPVSFSGSVGLSPKVFTGRYADLTQVLDELGAP